MIFQRDKFSCGPSALANAMAAVGIRMSEKKLTKMAGCTPVGTTSFGLQQVLTQLEMPYSLIDEITYSIAESQLYLHLRGGGSAALCVEQDDHWVACIGALKTRYIIFDSKNTKKNKAINGIHVLTPKQLRRFWTPCHDNKRFAILVYPE